MAYYRSQRIQNSDVEYLHRAHDELEDGKILYGKVGIERACLHHWPRKDADIHAAALSRVLAEHDTKYFGQQNWAPHNDRFSGAKTAKPSRRTSRSPLRTPVTVIRFGRGMRASMSLTSESSMDESNRDTEPPNIACALRLEISVIVCDLPPRIVSICLERETRRVRALATPGARATFYIIAPAPSLDFAAPLSIKFRLCDSRGQYVYSESLRLSQLLEPSGWSLPKDFDADYRDVNSSEVAESGANKKCDEALRILTSAAILSDPVKELPAVPSKILDLTDHRTFLSSVSHSEPLSFNTCARLRYAIPTVDIQCNTPNTTGIPLITHIQSPRKLAFWAVRRPLEIDDDEEQLIDIGDGVYAPKRNIARLRRAAMRGKEWCNLPAQNGRMSLLQACNLKPADALPPLTIPLGKPISLERSTVLDASIILDQEYQYIDDVFISDSESNDSGEADADEDEESGEECECKHQNGEGDCEVVDSGNFDDFASVSTVGEESVESSIPRKIPSLVDAVVSHENASDDTPALHKIPSRESVERKLSDGQVHENTDSEIAYAPLMRRVDKAERERSLLQSQLSCAHAERERLLEQLRAASLMSRCASLEAELIVLRQAHEKLQADHAVVISGHTVPTTSRTWDAAKDERKSAVGVAEKYKSQLKDMQHENERLLGVIGQLSIELERQPGAAQIVSELATAKTDLVVEKLENEKLARELAQMKAESSPTSVLSGSVKRSSDFSKDDSADEDMLQKFSF